VLADLVALVMITALAAYAILGGADFGVGAWDLTAGRGPRAHALRGRLERSMGPVWEANHVWLIFVLVACWTAFPEAFGAIMSTLYVPLFLAAVGIILRGSMYAFRGLARNPRHRAWLGLVFAAASVMTPFFLGTVVGGIASGRVPLGNAEGDPVTSWWNPTSVTVGVLAVVTGAYLSAVWAGADAVHQGEPDLAAALRVRALIAGVLAGVMAMAGLFVLAEDVPELHDELIGKALPFVILSMVAGAATLVLVWMHRSGVARYVSALAVAAIVWGYGYAQAPDLLPGEITIEEAAAPDAVLGAMVIAVVLLVLIVGPSLWYLWRLAARGDLSHTDTTIEGAPGQEGRDR
jgi:cytochrome d ubiquinol oxidase subunit II